jgi:creatinine amidohydrolase/Fe(II)-dependent formamide hydrolase-like protein
MAPARERCPGAEMKITDMNWMQVEAYLERDERTVVPIGSTEQHAGLSLGVDLILSERVSVEAAEPLGVPVFRRSITATHRTSRHIPGRPAFGSRR